MRTKKFWAVLLLMLTTTLSIRAAQVDTVQVKSEAMNKIVRVLYVVPDVAMGNSPQACPVVYLLHGYKDNFKAWIGIKPELPQIADDKGMVKETEGDTQIFIYPGYKFKCLDGLITNFHLPQSTLLMLVSALAGKDFIMNAYEEAVKDRYRFFSFGDAMFIK